MASELEQACEKHKITLTVWESAHPPAWEGSKSWFFVLHFEHNHMAGEYFTGSGVKGEPKVADVLHGVLSDAAAYANAPNIDDFAADAWDWQGGNGGVRKLIDTFEACARSQRDLEKLFRCRPSVLEELSSCEH